MLRSLLLASLLYGTQLGPAATRFLASEGALEALATDVAADTDFGRAIGQRLQALTLPGPTDRATLAAETLAVVSPLVERLGLDACRARLDDASFAVLAPEVHEALSVGQGERQALATSLSSEASGLLADLGLEGDLSARTKSAYSTWRKMQRKGLAVDEVMDRVAVRVVLSDEAACRTVLSELHERYEAVPGEFDDYIAHPKPNGYRSLHTVLRIDGQVAEVQLRTHEMHAHAEEGGAAHWRYKLAA